VGTNAGGGWEGVASRVGCRLAGAASGHWGGSGAAGLTVRAVGGAVGRSRAAAAATVSRQRQPLWSCRCCPTARGWSTAAPPHSLAGAAAATSRSVGHDVGCPSSFYGDGVTALFEAVRRCYSCRCCRCRRCRRLRMVACACPNGGRSGRARWPAARCRPLGGGAKAGDEPCWVVCMGAVRPAAGASDAPAWAAPVA